MKHKVPWNRTLLEDFIKEGLLTEDEEFINDIDAPKHKVIKYFKSFE